jgi:molecular chaperone DnaK
MAKDKATGKEQKIRIEASSGLSQEEIDRMKQEAEANAESDKRVKEEADKLNQADTLIFSTEKQLKEYGDKIPEDKRTAIEAARDQLKTAYDAKDFAGIDAGTEALNNAWQAASQDLYNAQQQEGADAGANAAEGEAQNGGSGTAEDVQDVDFEEVK